MAYEVNRKVAEESGTAVPISYRNMLLKQVNCQQREIGGAYLVLDMPFGTHPRRFWKPALLYNFCSRWDR